MRFLLTGFMVVALVGFTGCGGGDKVEVPKNPAPPPSKGPTGGGKDGGPPGLTPPPPVEP